MERKVFSLKAIVEQRETERLIAEKLATGKFTDSGEVYHPIQAKLDSTNPRLRLTAVIENGNLEWSK